MKVQLAVVSDLHCHSSGQPQQETLLLADALRAPASNHPIESLLQLFTRDGLRADALLVPGDLTNRVDRQGLISAWDFVVEIAAALRVQIVAPTLGNHDVDSRAMKNPDPFHLAKDFHPRSFPARDEGSRNCFWSNGYCLLETDSLRVLVINSVAHHRTEKDAKHGMVTNAQLEQIENALSQVQWKPFQVAVFHHHPIPHDILGLGAEDLMHGGDALLELLDKHKFRLVVHGHKHFPRLRYAPVGTHCLPVFASGSLAAVSVPMFSITRNTFHMIELNDLELPDCRNQGEIRTWVFSHGKGWLVPETQSADFPAVAGFGCHSQVDDLAQRTEALVVLENAKVVRFDQLVEKLPQLRYLYPKAFDAYRSRLEQFHGISILSAEPAIKWIGKLVG